MNRTRSRETRELIGSAGRRPCAVFHPDEPRHQAATRNSAWAAAEGIVFWRMVFAAAVLGAAMASTGQNLRHAAPEKPPQPQRRRHRRHDLRHTVMHLPLATGGPFFYLSIFPRRAFRPRAARKNLPATRKAFCFWASPAWCCCSATRFSAEDRKARQRSAVRRSWQRAGRLCRCATLALGRTGLARGVLSLVGMAMGAALATLTGWHSLLAAIAPICWLWAQPPCWRSWPLTHAYAVGRKFTVAALAYLTVVSPLWRGFSSSANKSAGRNGWASVSLLQAAVRAA